MQSDAVAGSGADSSAKLTNKRKRTAQACGPCRTKKTKCDGARPSCTPCTSLGYSCEYPLDSSAPSARQVMVNKSYLELLEARILRLEAGRNHEPQTLQRPQPSYSPVHAGESATPVSSERGLMPRDMGNGSEAQVSPMFDMHNDPPSPRRAPILTDGVDGMGLLLGPAKSPAARSSTGADREVYGEASGISFHRLLLDTLLPGYHLTPSSREQAADDLYSGFLGLPPTDVRFVVAADDLPSRNEANDMWAYFDEHTCKLYPFVDPEQLRKSYDELLDVVEFNTLSDPRNQPGIALHFVIFALVQNLSETQLTQIDVIRVALHMLRKHIDWPPSMVKVQVLLIGAMLMQGLDCPSFSWDLVGSAIRVAYAVGLHDPANSVECSPAEREYRLRTWWACYSFDRLVTLSIARPSAVTTVVPSLPLPSEIPGDPPKKNVRFFAESIRLYRALSDLITNPLSFHNGDKFLERVVADTYKLEKEYAHWADSLPPDLAFGDLSQPLTDPLVIVLALRGLTLRLLLHRRVVTIATRQHLGFARPNPQPGANVQTLEARQRNIAFGISLSAVIETAVQIVNLLLATRHSPIILNAPWYLLFYAMNAFMSLIATFLLNLGQWSTFVKTPGADIVRSLHEVHGFVRRLNDRYHRPSAAQALSIIEQLLGALGLPCDPAQPAAHPTAVDSADIGAWFNNITDLGSLPHLDLDELCRTLDLRFDDATWGTLA